MKKMIGVMALIMVFSSICLIFAKDAKKVPRQDTSRLPTIVVDGCKDYKYEMMVPHLSYNRQLKCLTIDVLSQIKPDLSKECKIEITTYVVNSDAGCKIADADGKIEETHIIDREEGCGSIPVSNRQYCGLEAGTNLVYHVKIVTKCDGCKEKIFRKSINLKAENL